MIKIPLEMRKSSVTVDGGGCEERKRPVRRALG